MWNPGEVIVSRGIYRNKVWSAIPVIVVRDDPEELVLTLLPGTECLVEETYSKGKTAANRLWDFKVADWNLAPFRWHTNRLLILPEWVRTVEGEIPRILHKLEKRQYPFDGSWLGWVPDPNWFPPTLPEGWDNI